MAQDLKEKAKMFAKEIKNNLAKIDPSGNYRVVHYEKGESSIFAVVDRDALYLLGCGKEEDAVIISQTHYKPYISVRSNTKFLPQSELDSKVIKFFK